MDESTKAAEISVATHLLHDLRYPPPHRPAVEKFVDDVGLGPTAFQYVELARFYQAVLEEYTITAPKGGVPVWEDIMSRLERSGAEPRIIEQWQQKYRELERGRCPNGLPAAMFLVNYHIAERSKDAVKKWSAQLEVAKVKEQVAMLCDGLMDIIASGGQMTRPAAILADVRERGWAKSQSTGYSRLDRSLGGGWRVPWLIVCAGPSEHGKSSMACNFASRRVEQGKPTLLNSFEMAAEEFLVRMICDLASVPLRLAREPSLAEDQDQYQAIMEAEGLIDQLVRIYDRRCDVLELKRRLRRHQLEFGQGLGLSIIDHIGRVGGKETSAWSRDLESRAYDIHDIGKELQVCQLMFSQVPWESEFQQVANNFATYTEGRGSRGIKQASDALIFMCKHNGRDKSGAKNPDLHPATVFQMAKLRETGKKDWFALRYNPGLYRLTREVVADRADIGMEPWFMEEPPGEVPF